MPSDSPSTSAAVHPCPRCGPVKWTIIRDVDHLAAECPRCKLSYDIGWSTTGYQAPDPAVLIPRDPEKRAALAQMAGLTDEERAALDQWCFDQEQERQQGVLLCEAERTHGC